MNIAAVIAVTGILARAWDERQFLLYGTANRFLTFLFCIASGSVGYAIVKNQALSESGVRQRVLTNAMLLITMLTTAVGCLLYAFLPMIADFLNEPRLTRSWVLPVVAWLFAQSSLHVLLAHLRSSDQLRIANIVHWCAKSLCVIAMAGTVWFLPRLSVPFYYGSVGILICLVCAAGMATQWRRIECAVDVALCRRMLSFSFSRIIDALLRNAFLVLVIMMLATNGQGRLGGQIAVITFLLRGIETLCQPLVMLIMTDSIVRDSQDRVREMIETTWAGLCLIAVPLMAALFFLSKPIVTFCLSTKHQGLSQEFGIIALSLLPTVSIVIFRGHLEGRFRVSPIMWSNVFGIVAIGCVIGWLQWTDRIGLGAITQAIVAIRWLQFGFIMWLLCRAFGVSPIPQATAFARLYSAVRERF